MGTNAGSGHIPAFDPPKKVKRNKYAIAAAFLASLASILLGYDIGVMSGAAIYIQKDLKINDTQVEILLGILNLYSLIGSGLAGRTSDWIGRRYTMVVASVVFFIGAILMGFSTNYTFLMVGRFVAGIGVDYALMIAPVYTAEVAPASVRGFLTSFPEVFINFGILVGYVSNFAFKNLPTHLSWRFMLGVGAIPSVLLGVSVLAMPESPRWLVMQGRLGDARRVLVKTSDSTEEAHMRLADIKEAAGIPEHCDDEVVTVTKKRGDGDSVWRELFISPTPAVLHILITGVGIHLFQQASGIDAVVLYGPRIFEKAGIKSETDKLLCTIAIGFTKTVFILVATFTLDKFGRRPLLLTSVGGMVATLALLGTALTVIDHSQEKVTWAVAMAIAMTLAYVAAFSIGAGPITWVYSSEIFPLKLRATGCSLGTGINRVTSGVVSMTFISLYKAISIGGSFFLYASIAAVGWVFFFTLMPETQGRTLEETEALFGTFFRWRSRQREVDAKKANNNNNNSQLQMGTLQAANNNK
nr:polyol transporter 5-like [Ipomoea batatas]